MAVTSEDNKATYAGDGATTSFSTVFTFSADDEVNVVLVTDSTGAEVSWTDGTQYTLTGAGTGVAGTLTVDTSPTDYTPASGETLVIELLPAFTQPDALPRGGTVSPKGELEPMFDRLLRQILRIKDQVDLSIKASSAETSIGALPNVANRKGYLLGFNATTGAPEVSTMTTANIESGATDAASSATDADTAKTAAEAAQTAAEAAQTAAETAETNAETAEANAEAVATGLSFTFAASTAMADPGTGTFRMNNATVSSVTALAFDATSAETGNPDVSDWIAAWDDISNAVGGGILTLKKAGTPATYAMFYVTAVTDNTGWLQTAVTHIDSNGTWSASDRGFAQFTPSGADGAGSLSNVVEDTTPQLGGDLDANGNQIKWAKGADVASAAALPVLTDGNYFDVTGTTAITSINTCGGDGTIAPVIKLHFDGALTLTHHATDLILPGGANITTAAGDEAEFVEYAAGDWRCTSYTKADGTPVVAAAGAGFVFLGAQTASASATLDFTSLMDGATYSDYMMTFHGFQPATSAASLQLQFSTDDGSTWETGSSGDHAYQEVTYGGTASDGAGSADEVIDLAVDCNNASAQTGGYIIITGAHGSHDTHVGGVMSGVPSAGGYEFRNVFGNRNDNDAVDAIRILFSSGNITVGTARLFGIKKS